MLKKIFKLFLLTESQGILLPCCQFSVNDTTFLFIYPEEEYMWVGYLDIKRWNITIFTEVEDQSHPL